MPLDCEVNIEKNAPVRLLNAVMERMDYSKLYAAYSRLENRVFTEDSAENHGVWVYAQADIQPCA